MKTLKQHLQEFDELHTLEDFKVVPNITVNSTPKKFMESCARLLEAPKVKINLKDY